jgi:hypothetical protein
MPELHLAGADTSGARELLLAAAAVIVMAVANEIASCLVRTLHRIETKLDRNTRETVRARQAIECNKTQEGDH